MAKKGDQDCQQEYPPNSPEIFPMLFGSPIIGKRSSPGNQTADKQRLDQPGDSDGSLQTSVNPGGIQQWTQLHFGQRGARNSIDQGRAQLQALMQQQPDTSRRKRRLQQSTLDSLSPEFLQAILEDKLARKRQADKRYRDRKRLENQQTEADLKKLRSENGQLKDENQKMKADKEKLEAENGQLKDECRELKSEVKKLKAEMKFYVVKLGAENRNSSRKSIDTLRSFIQGSGPPQVSGFLDVGSAVQPSNINPFDDWSHKRDNGVGECFTEEGTGIISYEMLENEDMQLMPRLFSMGGHASINLSECIPAPIPGSHEMLENEDMQLMSPHLSVGGHASINMLEDCYTFPPNYITSPMPRSHEMLENEDMQLMFPHLSVGGHASINMLEDCYTFPPNYITSPMPRSHEMLENEDMQFIRSLEMLENEDMQLMPPLFSMGGHASINMLEDCYTFSPNYIASPMPNFDEDRSHPGKIIVRWLKIKAFIWCGLSIRKKVAKRRPQIVEFRGRREW